MCQSYKFHCFFFILISLAAILNCLVLAASVTDSRVTTKDREELNDLNETKNYVESFRPLHPHRDEDMLPATKVKNDAIDLQQIFKNDAEILEANQVRKEDVEIEERYRGPSLILNTGKLSDENIEMIFEHESNSSGIDITILLISLFVILLIMIGVYVIVMKTSICPKQFVFPLFSQRSGIRELLVTTNNQDYWSDRLIS